MMRAVLQTGIRTVEVRDIPEPAPDDHSALVRVRAVGVCGSDLHIYHDRTEPETLPRGHETACGTCSRCQAGQPFHCLIRRTLPSSGGGFAELIKRRPAGLFTLPSN